MYPATFDDGIEARRTTRGHCLVTIHWWSQPHRRTREWYDKEAAKFPERFQFEQEYEINWNARAGDAYFPEFVKRGRRFFVVPAAGIMSGPIYRGWDFGTSRPAVVWGQKDETGRVWMLREIAPTNIDIHQFRDLVLYLSGQLEYVELERRGCTRAIQVINDINDPDSGYPPTPWFEGTSLKEWIDHGLPEAVRPSTIVTPTEKTDADVLASGGIYLSTAYVHLETREQVMRALLRIRPDGWPGIVWDPACINSIKMMNGGLTRKKDKTTGRHIGSEYNKVGLMDDLYDAHSAWLTQEIDPADFAPDGTIKPRVGSVTDLDSYLVSA